MAKARKLPSGRWNVRIYAGEGKYKSITRDTKREAELEAARFDMERDRNKAPSVTVRECVRIYLKERKLSPTTYVNYEKILNGGFKGFMDFPVNAITKEIAQRYIDLEAQREGPHGKISPKTVKNGWALISASVRKVTGVTWAVSLPQAVKKLKMYPDPEEVIKKVAGSSVELPCLLALWLSFTMSEIKGLKRSSIRDGYICIDRVLVQAGTEEIEKASGKTYYRNRAHALPPYLMALIEKTPAWQSGEDVYLIPDSRDTIYRRFKRLVPELSFHDLRHLSASIGLNELGLPEKVMQERGGWSTDQVMKTVYSHSFPRVRKESDEKINQFFVEILTKN